MSEFCGAPKQLCDMTVEELWQLFPIMLTAHNAAWSDWYAQEAARLIPLLPDGTDLYHIGSTAVAGIWAKPIIDILAEIDSSCDLKSVAATIARNGYIIMSAGDARISLNKGYTPDGFAERVFHLHLQYKSEKAEVLFRDYLNAHPDVAREYEQLKLRLWKQFVHDRDAYTAAKTEFVTKYTNLARRDKTE